MTTGLSVIAIPPVRPLHWPLRSVATRHLGEQQQREQRTASCAGPRAPRRYGIGRRLPATARIARQSAARGPNRTHDRHHCDDNNPTRCRGIVAPAGLAGDDAKLGCSVRAPPGPLTSTVPASIVRTVHAPI